MRATRSIVAALAAAWLGPACSASDSASGDAVGAGAAAAPGIALGALDAGPRTIPYGGYVDFDGEPVNASAVRFNFAIFPCGTPASCTPLWVARGTWDGAASWPDGWPSGPSDHVSLPVFAGRFTVALGDAGQSALPDALFTDARSTLYLAIRIEGRALGALQKLAPAFRATTTAESDRLRVRSAIGVDDPAGGSAELYADDGLVIDHDGAPAPSDTLLRVGGEAATLTVSRGGVVVRGALLVEGALGRLGSSPANPGRSCGAIHDADAAATDGPFWISPDDGPALEVMCDMANGGLTLAAFERGPKRPIAWWDMETLRGGRVRDLVGTNDLDIVGGPTPDTGRSGGAYRLDNAQQYFVSKDDYAATLTGAQRKSISAWVSVPAVGWADGAASIFGFGGSNTTGCAFGLSINSDTSFYFVGFNNDITSGWQVTTDEWHHLVATYDGRNVSLYVDGALAGRSPKALATGLDYKKYAVGIASWFSATLRPLVRGRIDEPKVYDYALDPEEVRQLFVLGQRGAE